MPTTDCTSSCSFLTSSTFNIQANQTYAIVALPTYFTLQFDYYNPTIHPYPAISNILDLQDTTTGQSLLYVSMPWAASTVLGYNGIPIEQWGPTLDGNCQSIYTTVTVIVKPGSVTITSSGNPGWVDTIYVANNVITASKLYYLYLSNPNVDFNHPAQIETHPSAGGTIKNIYITGE